MHEPVNSEAGRASSPPVEERDRTSVALADVRGQEVVSKTDLPNLILGIR
jgi:hypothetical protein